MSVSITTIPTGSRLSAGMTCPRCGAPMVAVSQSRAMVREWKAVLRCQACRAEQLLLVRLLEVAEPYAGGRGPEPAECGTSGGYHRHRREATPPCEDCLRAHADDSANYRQRHRERVNAAKRASRERRKAE